MHNMYNDASELNVNDPALEQMLATLRELPPEDPGAVHRIVAAAHASDTTPVTRPIRRWIGLAAGLGAAAAAFGVGFVAGNERVSTPVAAENNAEPTAHPFASPVARQVGLAQHATILFSLQAPTASRVTLVGDFNGWDPNATPMHRDVEGVVWNVALALPSGRYTYAFMVDGTITLDPAAPSVRDPDYDVFVSSLTVRQP